MDDGYQPGTRLTCPLLFFLIFLIKSYRRSEQSVRPRYSVNIKSTIISFFPLLAFPKLILFPVSMLVHGIVGDSLSVGPSINPKCQSRKVSPCNTTHHRAQLIAVPPGYLLFMVRLPHVVEYNQGVSVSIRVEAYFGLILGRRELILDLRGLILGLGRPILDLRGIIWGLGRLMWGLRVVSVPRISKEKKMHLSIH